MLCVAQDSHPSSLAAIALARAAWSVGRASLCKARPPLSRRRSAQGRLPRSKGEIGSQCAAVDNPPPLLRSRVKERVPRRHLRPPLDRKDSEGAAAPRAARASSDVTAVG